MEINKIRHPEKSAEKMVLDDAMKNKSRNSYCPDFSDICDDTYEFWDFLHNKKDTNEILTRDEERLQKSNFWDFLGPSSNKDPNSFLQSCGESIDSAITTPNDSGIHFEDEPQLFSKLKTNARKTAQKGVNLQSPELKATSSDDEFWDFLSCNSPVVTFKELVEDFNSANDDKESGISLLDSRCDESPFPSISDYMESERCSTRNSSPLSVSTKSKNSIGRESEVIEFYSKQYCQSGTSSDKLKETVASTDYTNYIDVLKYLNQECTDSGKEVRLPSIPRDKTHFYENSSNLNLKESEINPRDVGSINNEWYKINEKHCRIQELSQASLNNVQLNVSSSSQKPVYDGIAPNFVESKKDGNPNLFKHHIQQAERIQQLISKKPSKRFKRNIQNYPVASNFNKVGNSKFAFTNSSVNAVSLNQPKMQTSIQNINSSNSYHTENGIKNSNMSGVKLPRINPIVTHRTTPAISVTDNTTASNSNTNSAPLYLLMSSNPETLQNPNYSHFFLVINNNNNGNSQMNQPTFIKNSGVINTNNLKSNPTHLSQVLQPETNSEVVTKSDNAVKQNFLIVNQPNKEGFSSSASATKSSLSNVKYQAIPQVYLPYTSLINSADGTNQVSVQYVNKIPAVSNTINIPVPVNNLVTTSKVPSTISNMCIPSVSNNANYFSTVKSSGDQERTTNLKLDLKSKTTRSNGRQPLLKPIKNIALGKDKCAIQQISIPVPICGSEELNNSLGYSNLNRMNENPSLEKSYFEAKLGTRTNITASELLVKNVSDFRDALSAISNKNSLKQNESCPNTNFTSTSASVSSNLTPSMNLIKNTNSLEKCQTSSANSININVIPVSKPLQINKNAMIVNTIQEINPKNNQGTSNSDLNTSSLIPIAENSQSKSLATLQQLFPPPISMVPVCVLPQTQTRHTNQTVTPKILILKGSGKEQDITHKLKIDRIPNGERSISKKIKEKLRKGRLKTVRELLQERRKSGSGQLRSGNKRVKEVRVLRPVLRLSTCDVRPTTSPTIITKLNTVANSNNMATGTRKRPNILVLPSSKTTKKSVITEDRQGILVKEQESEGFANFSVSENVEDSLSSCTSSALDKKDNRPRHYDMSQLNIGDFRVDDDIDSCGRFRSKFKVIFSKRLFYYDFPVSRCNQHSLKCTDAWEQMARIAVPFKAVISMSLNERTIEVSINAPPAVSLGRLQARTGIIPNSTTYDIAVESDCTWGCMIRNSFYHKIILRKKQANKVKSFLYHFDDRFLNIINVSLWESGMNSVHELSVFDGEVSPTTLKQNVMKSKRHYIRRLSQWDSSENEDQKIVEEDDLVLLNQMCSCRVSCRSIRCSCVKAAKSCNSLCNCINCDNPLNILETLGMNLDFSLSDSCLFQNIYQIPKLVPFLTKEVKLTCCNTFARVQDCIPGTVLCPNVDCNVPLEFSWCKKMVCYPERNPRNHCSFCGQCCFSNGRHCMTCNRCYVVTSKFPNCPTCQEKTSPAPVKDMNSNYYNCDTKENTDCQKSASKSIQKPEIVILDVYSLPKTSTNTEKENESSNNTISANCDDSMNFEDGDSCKNSSDSVITID